MKIIKRDLLNAVKICSTVRNTSGIPLWDNLLFQCVNGVVEHIRQHGCDTSDGADAVAYTILTKHYIKKGRKP